jgi:hypothetical protein
MDVLPPKRSLKELGFETEFSTTTTIICKVFYLDLASSYFLIINNNNTFLNVSSISTRLLSEPIRICSRLETSEKTALEFSPGVSTQFALRTSSLSFLDRFSRTVLLLWALPPKAWWALHACWGGVCTSRRMSVQHWWHSNQVGSTVTTSSRSTWSRSS